MDKILDIVKRNKSSVSSKDDQNKYRCGCILGRRLDDAVKEANDKDVETFCTCNVHNKPLTIFYEMEFYCDICKPKQNDSCHNFPPEKKISEEENVQFKQSLLDLSNYKSYLIYNTDAALAPSLLLQNVEDKIVNCYKMESKCLRLMTYIEYYPEKALDKNVLVKLKTLRHILNTALSNFIPDEYKQYVTISTSEFEAMNLCICGNKRKPSHNVALQDTARTGISKEFVSKLSGFLCESDINVHTVDEDQQNEYNSYPLIVVCLNDSRLLTDIYNSLDKVQREDMSRVALITLHVKADDYSEPGDSDRALKSQEKKRIRQLGLITDWFYKEENKEKNKSTKEEIITFIKRKR
ncbi:uncharacterized protein LOC132751160 [Ruditapes philippinarum]|uniref:uncharacterized protein LOC132751160 n=1 Tax=Ruditapes philippinarum TaxID=129788 RepID=UPI00295B4C5E|nr:uncharacterized protein LOC132751160 [Ruditapes philippinarum]